MLKRAPLGISRSPSGSGRLRATTFMELVATILLLAMFAALGFSLYWGTAKAETSQGLERAAARAKLSLAALLPRLTGEIRPPYWANPDAVFRSSGEELTAGYRRGSMKDVLVFRTEQGSRLCITGSDISISIENLPGLSISWWEKEGRIIGLTVGWLQDQEPAEFHAAWGSFPL